ncbi:nitrite reductase small subunit NirD [Pigmentiphaga aceris]|uniref:Nitrite reductase small subunit NirD n=1 Tax=Pigmentiphaga aceris TaxID=1940612 RepID=A0A5C0AZQ0_9BURK|nr:nitrite reductase small subunit NirD [Pigmentiphaga aceris]QEI07942.1 nitrite reductase small subunit NirD [Pigmentiphaga aceris]
MSINNAWLAVCDLTDIVPDTGVCALIDGEQVAIFHVQHAQEKVFAIGNYDPASQAAVLSRGLVGSIGERVVVASPIYKQHFDLKTGECVESPEYSVRAYATRIEGGRVWVQAGAQTQAYDEESAEAHQDVHAGALA